MRAASTALLLCLISSPALATPDGAVSIVAGGSLARARLGALRSTPRRVTHPVVGLYESTRITPPGWEIKTDRGENSSTVHLRHQDTFVGHFKAEYDKGARSIVFAHAFLNAQPRWVPAAAGVPALRRDQGTPTATFGQLRLMQDLQVPYAGLARATVGGVVHLPTVLAIAKTAQKSSRVASKLAALQAEYHASRSSIALTQYLDTLYSYLNAHPRLLERLPAVQTIKTVLTQSGHRIVSVRLRPAQKGDGHRVASRMMESIMTPIDKVEMIQASGLAPQTILPNLFDIELELAPRSAQRAGGGH